MLIKVSISLGVVSAAKLEAQVRHLISEYWEAIVLIRAFYKGLIVIRLALVPHYRRRG